MVYGNGFHGYIRSQGKWERITLCVNDSVKNDTANDVTILIYDKQLDSVVDIAAFGSDGRLVR